MLETLGRLFGRKQQTPPPPGAFDKRIQPKRSEQTPQNPALDSEVREMRERKSTVSIGGASEASHDHPDRNEDAFFMSVKRGLIFVADGMGGVPAGDQASAQAAGVLTREGLRALPPAYAKIMEASPETPFTQNEVEAAIKATLHTMNSAVERMVDASGEIGLKAKQQFVEQLGYEPNLQDQRDVNMLISLLQSIGAAGSLAKLWRDPKGQDHITIGQVGDTRIYRLRNGELACLTEDDSPLRQLMELGIKDKDGVPIVDDQDVNREIKKEDIVQLAQQHPSLQPLLGKVLLGPALVKVGSIRNIMTQALGATRFLKKQYGIEFKPTITTERVEDGDLYIAVSDGITDNSLDSEIQEVLLEFQDKPLEAAQELQRQATLRSIKGEHDRAKKDDATAVVLAYRKAAQKQAPIQQRAAA